ncbi:methionine biosynthesis protein MetW [Inhella sp.]|uniref:methionine biosynthesis protein MetW n=1 Tax=Inhella sp. TaxID=1921806 RepID=UPI0035B12989
MKAILDLIAPGSRVLDLGCGSGALLHELVTYKGCSGYGIELDDANLLACAERGVNVLQLDLERGLSMFKDHSFDVVLQLQTLQQVRHAEAMLRETVRVGRRGVVSFPNFAHWPNRLQVMAGRMPVTRTLPYQWYDTPNIRVGTHADFALLCDRLGIRVLESFGLRDGQRVDRWPNALAPVALFVIEKA